MRRGSQLPWIVKVVVSIDVLLMAISLYNALCGPPFEKFGLLFNLDAESNLPTWYASIQLFVVSIALGIVAWRSRASSRRQTWLFWSLPAMFLLFSIDEVAMIHDWLGYKIDELSPLLDRHGTAFALTGFWGFVIGVPCLVGAVMLIRFTGRLFQTSRRAYWKVFGGSVVFISSAAGIDTSQNFVAQSARSLYVVVTHAEEFLELVSISFVLWGVCDLLASLHFTVGLDSIAALANREEESRNDG
jgi:hypothetical protein